MLVPPQKERLELCFFKILFSERSRHILVGQYDAAFYSLKVFLIEHRHFGKYAQRLDGLLHLGSVERADVLPEPVKLLCHFRPEYKKLLRPLMFCKETPVSFVQYRHIGNQRAHRIFCHYFLDRLSITSSISSGMRLATSLAKRSAPLTWSSRTLALVDVCACGCRSTIFSTYFCFSFTSAGLCLVLFDITKISGRPNLIKA